MFGATQRVLRATRFTNLKAREAQVVPKRENLVGDLQVPEKVWPYRSRLFKETGLLVAMQAQGGRRERLRCGRHVRER